VTIDTLRADHVGAYGGHPVTPNLDALAAEGALFEVAYAPMGTTCPSHATLFTSRHPVGHGVLRNGLRLRDDELTLAERLRGHGFTTAAFVSAYPLKGRFGFRQGFDHYDDDFTGSTPTLPRPVWEGEAVEGTFDRRGGDTVDRAVAWLSGRDEGPLFVWVHLFDPHWPYLPPQEEVPPSASSRPRRQRERLLYAAEVHYADAQVGRVVGAFRERARDPSPLIVVTSDHGEGLYDHGWRAHNRYLYEEEVRVPWVIHWQGQVSAGHRLSRPVHLVDVAPTLLGLLGLGAPDPGMEGVDLAGSLRGHMEAEAKAERPIWLQRPFYPEGRPNYDEIGSGFGLRLGRWKLIEAAREGRRELYDLEADPGENDDLALAEPERAEALATRLADWRRAHPMRIDAGDLDPEELEALRALGYVD
jgi:arylsulfatase A-like enzyme